MKHLLSTKDLGKEDVEEIFDLVDKVRANTFLLKGKTLGMIFEKPSLRTKVSFAVAMEQLGGSSIYLSRDEIKIGERESIKDVAKVMSRYVDCIMIRTFDHDKLVEFANNSDVPVINGLDDLEHPCQALADLYTMKQKLGSLEGKNIVFIGDCENNTFRSLSYLCRIYGMEVHFLCPHTDESAGNLMLEIADVFYTDTFVSMGQEDIALKKLEKLKSFQLNSKLLENNERNYIIMHPLPAHRGVEITDEVIDGEHSVVYDQAENRLHVQKAILLELMKREENENSFQKN